MRRLKRYPETVLNLLENPASEDANNELIFQLIDYICDNEKEGAILVFLSGLDEITKMIKILKNKGFGDTCNV